MTRLVCPERRLQPHLSIFLCLVMKITSVYHNCISIFYSFYHKARYLAPGMDHHHGNRRCTIWGVPQSSVWGPVLLSFHRVQLSAIWCSLTQMLVYMQVTLWFMFQISSPHVFLKGPKTKSIIQTERLNLCPKTVFVLLSKNNWLQLWNSWCSGEVYRLLIGWTCFSWMQ